MEVVSFGLSLFTVVLQWGREGPRGRKWGYGVRRLRFCGTRYFFSKWDKSLS